MSPPNLARNLGQHDRCDEPQRRRLYGFEAEGRDPHTISCATTELAGAGSDDDQLPAAVRQLHALNRGPRAGRCDEDDLLVASHAVEPCAMDAERILVSARCGSRLSPHRGGTIKPAGTPILEQNPMEAERRCRTQA